MRSAVALFVCGCGRLGFDAGSAIQDGPSTPDVAIDAPDFCAVNAQAMFCSDLSSMGVWSLGNQLNASWELVDGTLHVTSTPVVLNDDAEAYLVYTLSPTATRVTGSTDVRIEQLGTGEPVLLELRMTTATSIHGVEYVYQPPPSLSYIEEFRDARDGSPVLYDAMDIPGSVFPAGEWHRIELMFDVGVATPHVVASLDGAALLDTPLVGNTGGAGRVEVGLVYVKGPADAWEMRFDNVLAESQ